MKKIIVLLGLLVSAAGFAGTANLPDPDVVVNVASGATVATFYTRDANGNILTAKSYRATSQFVYFGECAKPDAVRYRCDIDQESNVVLVAPDGSTAIANLTVQFASTLIVSGHNYWRQSETVLAGDVTR